MQIHDTEGIVVCLTYRQDYHFFPFVQAFRSILLKAKEEEVTKRRRLLDFFEKIDGLMNKMPTKEDFTLLQKQLGPDIKKNMKVHMDQLKEEKCYLLVTGKYTRENRH